MADKMYSMNPQRQRHMEQGAKESSDVSEESGQHHAPIIHIHSHDNGHTVHVMHKDGSHTKHEHEHGDAEGIKSHIDKHIGGKTGQDHGDSSDNAGEEEGSLI